ncbi:MAG: efflux RND transporter periplasmic adaptor subunit [Thermoanaerobaculia bacterium]
MDRPIDPRFKSRQSRLRILAALIAVGAIAGAIAISRSAITPTIDRGGLRTARVERGVVAVGLAASGTVVPSVEKVIASPIEARVMRILRQAGAAVQPGDEIVLLDGSSSELELRRLEQQHAQKRNERLSIEADLEATLAELAGQVEEKRLDAEILQYRETQSRALRTEGLISEEAYRQAVVAARKAGIELERLESRIAAARRSAARDTRALDLEIDVLTREIEQSRGELDRATASSDRAGVLTWVTPQEGAVVRRGETLARVADLGTLRILGSISDVHAESVRPGMTARVRTGELRYDGRVVAVDPTVTSGVVSFTIDIEAEDVSALRNNQRVDIDLYAGTGEVGLKIPRGSYGVAGGKDVVFRLVEGEAIRTPVRFGRSDGETIEVVEGLSEGDEIVISDMSALWHAGRVDVKDRD